MVNKQQLFEQLRSHLQCIKENVEESDDTSLRGWIRPLCREANQIIDKLEGEQ